MNKLIKFKLTVLVIRGKILWIPMWKKGTHNVLESINYRGEDYDDFALVEERVSTDLALLDDTKKQIEDIRQEATNYRIKFGNIAETDKSEIDGNINMAISKIINVATARLNYDGKVDMKGILVDMGIRKGWIDEEKLWKRFKKRIYNEFNVAYRTQMEFDNNKLTVTPKKK